MFFYNDGQNDVGPFSISKLLDLKASKIISDQSLVRSEVDSSWSTFEEIVKKHAIEEGTEKQFDMKPALETKSEDEAVSGSVDEEDREKPEAATEGGNWLSSPPTPWRRYGARIFDFTFNGILGFSILAAIFFAVAPYTAHEFFSIFESKFGRILDLMMTGFVASIIGGALIGVSGMTLGKWVFGIKVTKLNGSNLGLVDGIVRDLDVYIRGLGFAIPLISLMTMLTAYSTLKKKESTSWDAGKYLISHRRSSAVQTILNIIGVIMIFLIIALTRVVDQM